MVSPLQRPPLVGRSRELTILTGVLSQALAGHGRMVLVEGEAGVGKTVLTAALCHRAERDGAIIAEGRCYDLNATPPYGPWTELIATVAPAEPLFGAPPPVDHHPVSSPSQAAMFQRAWDTLANRATDRPLLLVIEDAHWSDAASIDLLRFVARRLADHPIVLLVTYRGDELFRRHPLQQVLPLLEREGNPVFLHLARLDREAVRDLLGHWWMLPPNELDRLVSYVVQRTSGNAFLTVQLAQSIEEQHVVRLADDRWSVGDLDGLGVPVSVRQIVDALLGRMTEDEQAALELAAIVGQEVPVDVWAVAAGLDDSQMMSIVESALRARLVEVDRSGATFRFLHALLREALYESILPLRRRQLHRRVAEALLAQPRVDPDAAAFHLDRAGDARAIEWHIRAADRAEEAYAMVTAIEHLTAAMVQIDRSDGDRAIRARLRLRLALMRRYEAPRDGIALLDGAEKLTHDAGDPRLAGAATLVRGMLRCHAGNLTDGVADMRVAIDMTGSGLGSAISALEAYAAYLNEGTLILWLALAGFLPEARQRAERYLAAHVDRPATLEGAVATAGAWSGLSVALAMMGKAEAAREADRNASAALAPLIQRGMLAPSANSIYTRAMLPYLVDRPGERRRLFAEAERISQRNQSAQPLIDERALGAAPQLSWLLAAGRWTEAHDILSSLQSSYGDSFGGMVHLDLAGELAREMGDREAAWESVRAVWPDGPDVRAGVKPPIPALGALRLAARLALDDDDPDTALAWLDTHERVVESTGSVLGRAEGEALRAMCFRLERNRGAAIEHALRALANASEPRQPLALIEAHQLLASLALDDGDGSTGIEHLAVALALTDACEAPYARALVLVVQAEVSIGRGDVAAAELAVREARATCEPIGAKRCLADLDAIEAHLPASGRRSESAPKGLSAREVEVLRLLADGNTNQQIADALWLSVRTVERHITNAYGKIGVHGRAGATAFVLKHLS